MEIKRVLRYNHISQLADVFVQASEAISQSESRLCLAWEFKEVLLTKSFSSQKPGFVLSRFCAIPDCEAFYQSKKAFALSRYCFIIVVLTQAVRLLNHIKPLVMLCYVIPFREAFYQSKNQVLL